MQVEKPPCKVMSTKDLAVEAYTVALSAFSSKTRSNSNSLWFMN